MPLEINSNPIVEYVVTCGCCTKICCECCGDQCPQECKDCCNEWCCDCCCRWNKGENVLSGKINSFDFDGYAPYYSQTRLI